MWWKKNEMIINKPNEMSQSEALKYVDIIQERHGKIDEITIDIDGEYVDIEYKKKPINFERIRRITGYLVGTLDTWNNGKRAEEHDRVKHDTRSKI